MSTATSRHQRSTRMFPFTLWILNALILSHGSNWQPDEHEGVEFPEDSSQQTWLEGMSTIEELLELLYPDYALAQRCLRRMTQGVPALPYREDNRRSPREAIQPQADEAIKAIIKEVRLTACQPREVCVEVSKEYADSTSRFFLPRCVSVHRCGGCCPDESQDCIYTSYTLVQKALLELTPVQENKSIIKATFANHTACKCQPKRPLHTIGRRATATSLLSQSECSPPDAPCGLGLAWDPTKCKCMPKDSSPLYARELAPLHAVLLVLCGPNRILEGQQCKCTCQNGLTQTSCGPHQTFDEAACQCVCRQPPATEACPPNQRWDPEMCSCVCQSNCTLDYSSNPEKCRCQCRNSPRTCRLNGMTFRPESCSCHRPSSLTRHRICVPGTNCSNRSCRCAASSTRTGTRT